MKQSMHIYHGSQQIVETPILGMGKKYNDYGQGFYCTENKELAKEWACPIKNNGYISEYLLHTTDLNVMYLTRDDYNILNWLALLLNNRKFDINSPMGNNAKDFILSNYLPETENVDVIIGYRADDSYFSFAEDFINNTISLRDLNLAMQLGTLGEQVVLLSEHAFKQIEFITYEVTDYHKYYYKRNERDINARTTYANRKKNLQQVKDDIYILDIIREDMPYDDPRLQFNLSK